ncbi:hypothetical protein GRX03_02345 [Halovenus sp. WSH3]|uniref:Uncharacterized protein n=1 Tax=Halovenus carboxidivorans TaxID=2692199 RepID=A0A6B0T2I8_9EURY|nr:hypothetical protein [Halovenus carboxidivorans]MXR50446.1 hypothetical protein [Halovenus carboxidivorans]
MSDTDDKITELGQHALRTARVEGLRRQMDEFIQLHDSEQDLKDLRAGVDSMSELVND